MRPIQFGAMPFEDVKNAVGSSVYYTAVEGMRYHCKIMGPPRPFPDASQPGKGVLSRLGIDPDGKPVKVFSLPLHFINMKADMTRSILVQDDAHGVPQVPQLDRIG